MRGLQSKHRVIAWVFVVGCVPPARVDDRPPLPATGCDLAAHTWQQSQPAGCEQSQWNFVRRADGSFDARETGCAGATGTARYDGATVVADVEWWGNRTRYVWPVDARCQGGPGEVMTPDGTQRGPSTFTLVAATR